MLCAIFSVQSNMPVFANHTPDFVCAAPVNSSLTDEHIEYPPEFAAGNFTYDRKCVENCTHYEYDNSYLESTIITEFKIFCDSYLADTATSFYFIGMQIGCILLPTLGKKYSRREMICISGFFHYFSAVIGAYAKSIYVYIFSRLCMGAAGIVSGAINIYLVEIVGYKFRTQASFSDGIAYALGVMLLSYPFSYFFHTEMAGFEICSSG